MKIRLVNIGKIDVPFLEEGVKEYTRRINHLLPFEITDLKVKRQSKNESPEQVKQREGEQLLKVITNSSYVIMLDEKGKEFSSRAFSSWMGEQMNQGQKELVFISGGAFGFSEEIYKKANLKISLSKMTFTHQMVRLIFTEQLYRAMTLLKGLPYHND